MRSGSFSTGTVITNRGRFTKSVKWGQVYFGLEQLLQIGADLLQ